MIALILFFFNSADDEKHSRFAFLTEWLKIELVIFRGSTFCAIENNIFRARVGLQRIKEEKIDTDLLPP